MQPVRPSGIAARIWERYDLCAAVNRAINEEWRNSPADAIAEAKAAAVLKKGVPLMDVTIAELSIDGGGRYAPVVLVRDRIARWVLRADACHPETLPRLGIAIRNEHQAGLRSLG
jgi:hypothetical protein